MKTSLQACFCCFLDASMTTLDAETGKCKFDSYTHFDDDVQFYEGIHTSHVQLWLETSHLGKIMPLNHTLTNGMNANAKVGLICIIFNVMFLASMLMLITYL